MKTYCYFHDWNSDGEKTAHVLSEVLGTNIIIMDWKENLPFIANIEYIKKQLGKMHDVVLCGSSMGAFYANYLSNLLQLPCILFNPVIEPLNVLKKFKGHNRRLYDDFTYTLTNDLIRTYDIEDAEMAVGKVVIIGRNDKTIDCDMTAGHFENIANVIVTNDGHTIENLDRFTNALKSTKSSIWV